MKIQMGNDEFILYIRKNGYGLGKTNVDLGRKIWVWIRGRDASARQTTQAQPCHWGDEGASVGEYDLPSKATQFEFDDALLPEIYVYLSTL